MSGPYCGYFIIYLAILKLFAVYISNIFIIVNNELRDIFLYNYSHLDYFLRITNENEITQSIEYILVGLDINQERQAESHRVWKALQRHISR